MHNGRDRGERSRSYQSAADNGSRPSSHNPSDAFAYGIATEAMRNAAEAMSRAAAAMDARASMNMQTVLPTSPTSSLAALLGTPPDIPNRSSSIDHAPEKPQAAYLGHHHSPVSLKTPLEMYPRRPHDKQHSHMDLLDAANMHDQRNEKMSSRYSAKSYAEDVADRNMGGAYDTRSRSSSLPLAPGSTPPLSSFDPEPPEEEHGHGHGHSMSLLHEIMFIAVICQAQLLTQCALAQTIAPLPYIAKTFEANNNPSSLAWYSAGFALTVGTFILPSGRLGDVYGHKLLFIIGWAWFALSSLLCGFAPMIQQSPARMGGSIFFVVARALQGIGPAIVMPNGLALMGTTYPPGKKKNMLFALFGACAPAGFVIGATFSSLLAQKGEWAWGFWVMAGVCAGLALLTLIFIPAPHHPAPPAASSINEPRPTVMKRMKATATLLDIPGAILGVTALLLINISLNQAPLADWSTPYTYFLLIIGIVILGTFFYQQSHAPSPLIPSSILNRATVFVLICTACGWASMGIWIFYIWSYMERLHLLSPLLASAWFAPAPIAGCVASVVTGFGLSKGKPQWVMLASMVAFFVGTTLIATANPDRSYWMGVFFSIVIMPFGMDMSFPSATLLVSDRAGRGSQGMAASVVNTVVNYSISIGLGLAGTVVMEIGADVVDPGESVNKELLRGFRSAWWTGMGLSGTGIIVAAVFCGIVHSENRRRNGAGREKR